MYGKDVFAMCQRVKGIFVFILILGVLSACSAGFPWNPEVSGEAMDEGSAEFLELTPTPTPAAPSPPPVTKTPEPATKTPEPTPTPLPEVVLRDGVPENLYAATLQELGDMWADAFSCRQADTLYALCHDKVLFWDIGGSQREDGSLYIGMSSPWANGSEPVVTVRGEGIEILYYWHASPTVMPSLESLSYTRTDEGYQATGITALEIAVTSKAMYDLYWGKGTPGAGGLLEYYTTQTQPPYDVAAIAAAALYIQDVDAVCEQQEQEDGGHLVTFAWPDGSVQLPAWIEDYPGGPALSFCQTQ